MTQAIFTSNSTPTCSSLASIRDSKSTRKAEAKLNSIITPESEKGSHVYWTKVEHAKFLEAVKTGYVNDYKRMK